MTPTPLEVAQRNSEPRGITGEEAQRWLEAHKPNDGMDWRQAKLELARRKMQIDADAIALLGSSRRQYRPGLEAQAARDQQAIADANLLALATARRVNQLREAGHDVPDTSTGNTSVHPAFGPNQPAVWYQPPSVNMSEPAKWV